MRSFASAKGPLTTVRFPPANLMRAPLALDWSPERSSSTPAFASSSLYFVMAAMSCSSGIIPASESLLALTIIMNRIVRSPCCFGDAAAGFRLARPGVNPPSTVRRTRRRETDTPSVVDRLVDRGPEIGDDVRTARRIPQALRHEDRDHVLLRIHVGGGAVAAVPAEPARDTRQIVAPGDDGQTEAPAAAVPEAGEEVRSSLLFGGDMVRRHQLD